MAELLKDVPAEKRLDACLKGLKAYKGKNARHLQCLTGDMKVPNGTWAESKARLETLRKMRGQIKAFAEEQSKLPGREWLAKAGDSVDDAIEAVEKWLSEYGQCRISFAGKPLEQWIIVRPVDATPFANRRWRRN